MKNRYASRAAALFTFVCLCLAMTGCGGGGGAPEQKVITNPVVLSAITDGTSLGSFTDIASYIDTKVPIEGASVFPASPTLDPALKAIVLSNVNNFLDTAQTPIFSSGSAGPFAGAVIDQTLKKITVNSGATTVSWRFEANKVTRTYNDGQGQSSSYVYSTVDGQTKVAFDQTVNKTYFKASYKGSATIERDAATGNMTKFLGASFVQNHAETNSLDNTSNTVNGTVTMRAEDAGSGNLSFDGSYSVYIAGTGQVHGTVKSDSMTYLAGYKADEGAYYNSNVVDSTAIVFTSTTDYSVVVPINNPVWLQGIWTGSFTDGAVGDGMMQMSVPATSITWWGQSADFARFYGTTVKYVNDNKIDFYEGAALWGTGAKTGAQTIAGNWTLNGRSGSFTLSK